MHSHYTVLVGFPVLAHELKFAHNFLLKHFTKQTMEILELARGDLVLISQ